MLKRRSIYKEFATKLIIATSLFVLIVSFIFYGFTKTTIYEGVVDNLIQKAKLVYNVSKNLISPGEQLNVLVERGILIDLVEVKNLNGLKISQYKKNNNHYIEVLYPFDLTSHTFIQVIKNINAEDKMLKKIFSNVTILGGGGLILIILYALAVSKTLLFPIINITKKLSKMNENSLTQLNVDKLPEEFHPLASSINQLTKRIENYLKYQKELFIGAAHELKTPLAVIKLKSQATLVKKRDPQKYQDVLKLIVNEVDGMNKMLSSILDFGRAEGAQLEHPVELEIISFLTNKIQDYKLIAKEKKIEIIYNCEVKEFKTIIQPTLLTQIIQNFVQNAIKFTPEFKKIEINIKYTSTNYLKIEVIDEGPGIDENIDLFAPFKRIGNKEGAGLGLFLAKSAADTINAHIDIKNRNDKQGTIATLVIQANPTCKIN